MPSLPPFLQLALDQPLASLRHRLQQAAACGQPLVERSCIGRGLMVVHRPSPTQCGLDPLGDQRMRQTGDILRLRLRRHTR